MGGQSTSRESARLYKFLNQLGYTVVGIDAAIEREKTKNRFLLIRPPT
jgi:hypothetical protein